MVLTENLYLTIYMRTQYLIIRFLILVNTRNIYIMLRNSQTHNFYGVCLYSSILIHLRALNGHVYTNYKWQVTTWYHTHIMFTHIYITCPHFIIRNILLDFGSTTIIHFYNIYHNHRNNNILAPLD